MVTAIEKCVSWFDTRAPPPPPPPPTPTPTQLHATGIIIVLFLQRVHITLFSFVIYFSILMMTWTTVGFVQFIPVIYKYCQ